MTAGVFNDMIFIMVINIASDIIAQLSEKKLSLFKLSIADFDLGRLGRFATFGFFDGVVQHNWFVLLDFFIQGESMINVFQRMLCEAVIYTPCWCLWFLLVMAILEQKKIKDIIPYITKKEGGWVELVILSSRFYIPLSFFVYFICPDDWRLATHAFSCLVFETIVSLWMNKTDGETSTTVHEKRQPQNKNQKKKKNNSKNN